MRHRVATKSLIWWGICTSGWGLRLPERHRGRLFYPVPMTGVDLVDETFILVAPARIATVVADPGRWRGWWPTLELTVFMDRGLQGIRWSITGELAGSAEIWLEAHGDGVLLHYYLRGNPTVPGSSSQQRTLPDSARGRREIDRLRKRLAIAWKRNVWSLKDEMEGDRRPGEPR